MNLNAEIEIVATVITYFSSNEPVSHLDTCYPETYCGFSLSFQANSGTVD
jgi:hypothetical protein